MTPPDFFWLILSISVAAVFGFVNVIDRFFVRHDDFNPALLTILISLTGILPVFLIYFYDLKETPWHIILLSIFNGSIFVLFIYLYFCALSQAATDIVIAGLQISAIFSLVWAHVFFNEFFYWPTYIGIAFILVGLFLLSLHRYFIQYSDNNSLFVAISYTFGAAVILSIGMSIQKYSTTIADPLAIFFWGRIGNLITITFFLLLLKKLRDETFKTIKHYKGVLFQFMVLEQFYFLAVVLRIYAVSYGYLTLVATFVTAQPLFVTLYLFVLKKIGLPVEHIEGKDILLQILFISLVVLGALVVVWTASYSI